MVDIRLARGNANPAILSAGDTRPYRIWSGNFSATLFGDDFRAAQAHLSRPPPVQSRAVVWAEVWIAYGSGSGYINVRAGNPGIHRSISPGYVSYDSGGKRIVFVNDEWNSVTDFSGSWWGTTGYSLVDRQGRGGGGNDPAYWYIGYWG